MFNQQHFEDKVYELVVGMANEYFSTPRSDAETLKAIRQILKALHWVIEEQVVQVLYATQMRVCANKLLGKGGNEQ